MSLSEKVKKLEDKLEQLQHKERGGPWEVKGKILYDSTPGMMNHYITVTHDDSSYRLELIAAFLNKHRFVQNDPNNDMVRDKYQFKSNSFEDEDDSV